MQKKITLKAWAKRRYDSDIPCMMSLYNAAKNGMFNPPAQKEFGRWRVFPDAVIIHKEIKQRRDDPPELLRILNDGKAP